MKILLLDLWNDLRAKRMWPAALALLVALVAVPVLLSKPAEEPKSPPAASVSQAKTADQKKLGRFAQVRLADEEPGDGSTLGVFDPDNPFTPPEGAVKKESDQAPQSAAGPSDSAPSQSGDTGSGGGGSGGGGSGDTGGTTQPPTGGGGGAKTSEFTYVLDVTFWANGRRRKIEGLEKLDMLPNQAAPLLIFMGVTDNAGNAVFLVDSTLNAAGEGKCKPSRDECAFLYLGAGSEEEFTNDDGDSYRLIINEIRKVKVGDESGTAASGKDSTKASGKTARAAIGTPRERRRFDFPTLTDLVVESGEDIDNSTGADQRR
jgi:hypothetical protein